MSNKADLIKRLEELEVKKKALEAPQSVTVATFEGEPSAIGPKEKQAEAPAHRGNGNGDAMPESLRGLSLLDLSLLDIDGLMTPAEQAFYDKRKWKIDEWRRRNFPPSPLDWMR